MALSLLDTMEVVPMAALTVYPGNPRRGNVDMIAESLEENGQFAPLVVQKSTGFILSGNHTFLAAQQNGDTNIGVVYVDVDDDRARRIVLAANRTSDVSEYDPDGLRDILNMLSGNYAGTGYTDEDLDDLIASMDKGADDVLRATAATTDYDGGVSEFPPGQSGQTGSVQETVLLLNAEDHAELHAHLDALRASATDGDLTNGAIVLRAVREAHANQ